MKEFATLVNSLDSTNKTNLKTEAIIRFISEAKDRDKLWFLALFTGKRPKRNVSTALMRQWAMEKAGIPEWIFQESYSSVGDLGETISLVLPPPTTESDRSLSQWMEDILNLRNVSEEEKKRFVLSAWDSLSGTSRFIFNKLLGGSFRLGVSSKTLINALSKHFQIEPGIITHSIMGNWVIDDVNFDGLIRGEFTDTKSSQPYPFCLAYPLEKETAELGPVNEWQIEYKWDGIRGQFIKRDGKVYIWSRGEELVTDQFPELKEQLQLWEGNFVMDGEILVIRDNQVADFSELQKRLNRKSITKKMLQDYPIRVLLYDLLEFEGEDWRNFSLETRRAKLEELVNKNPDKGFSLSQIICPKTWDGLNQVREDARTLNSEGLMLKSRQSVYHAGRKKGDWWKWKIDPLTIDAVLVYAQKGSGRRSGHYTDYTFAVKKGDELVTIAKAYSGLTNQEIQEVSRFVNKNAVEKFGPVRTVKPELVFEIAFEGISFSNRHKSGVALRFPRILRWRKDKTVAEIDDIDEIKKLIM